MTSPSFNEAFVIIRLDENGRPCEIIRHNTEAFTYMASPIDLSRQTLKTPTVKTAFKELVEDFDQTLMEIQYKDLPEDEVVKIFIDMVMEYFPILFIDPSLTNPDYRAVHWRSPGDGADFDTRKQSIVLNAVVSRSERNLASSRIEKADHTLDH